MGYRPESRLKKDHLGLEPGRQSPPLWGPCRSVVPANFLTRQFAKRTAFLRKREEKKVLQAKPPIVSTLFQSFLDTQRVN